MGRIFVHSSLVSSCRGIFYTSDQKNEGRFYKSSPHGLTINFPGNFGGMGMGVGVGVWGWVFLHSSLVSSCWWMFYTRDQKSAGRLRWSLSDGLKSRRRTRCKLQWFDSTHFSFIYIYIIYFIFLTVPSSHSQVVEVLADLTISPSCSKNRNGLGVTSFLL